MNTPAMLSWLFWFSTTGGPPSDTMVLMSAVCAPAEPAPTQHKVRNAPQAAPEKCLMTCLAIEKDLRSRSLLQNRRAVQNSELSDGRRVVRADLADQARIGATGLAE